MDKVGGLIRQRQRDGVDPLEGLPKICSIDLYPMV